MSVDMVRAPWFDFFLFSFFHEGMAKLVFVYRGALWFELAELKERKENTCEWFLMAIAARWLLREKCKLWGNVRRAVGVVRKIN